MGGDDDQKRDTESYHDDFTKDGTVDLKGNPLLSSKTGGWKACSFVVVYEVFERMAHSGISSNLVTYLTKKLHQGTVTSSNNVTNWKGTNWILPILGAYIADAYLGRYFTFVIASVIYLMGMGLLTLTVSLHSLRPPPCHEVDIAQCKQASPLQLAMFYFSLYLVAIGTGGTKPNISTIGADQFDEFDPKEKAQKLSFFNWWMFSVFFGSVFAHSVLVHIQDNVGWSLGYGIPTIGLAISIIIFLAGTPFYRHRKPSGSSFTRMTKVIFVALRKWRVPCPSDPRDLYELDLEEYSKKGKFRIQSTPSLRFLNKASVKTNTSNGPWMLCTVTQVEETKQMLLMIPIFISTLVPSIMAAQVHTLFVKQGSTLKKSIGTFNISPGSLTMFVDISMLITVVLYDRVFVRIIRKWTKNPRGITLLQRMGIGLVILTITMACASLVERKRLMVAKVHGVVEKNGIVPLSIFILLPQFVLMGISDAFVYVSNIEFFYDQAPESMKSLGTSYSLTSHGLGNFLSSFLLSTVSNITKTKYHKGWIRNNLNVSHLDYYYAFFVILNVLNLIFFLIVSKVYVYRAEVSNFTESPLQEIQRSKRRSRDK